MGQAAAALKAAWTKPRYWGPPHRVVTTHPERVRGTLQSGGEAVAVTEADLLNWRGSPPGLAGFALPPG